MKYILFDSCLCWGVFSPNDSSVHEYTVACQPAPWRFLVSHFNFNFNFIFISFPFFCTFIACRCRSWSVHLQHKFVFAQCRFYREFLFVMLIAWLLCFVWLCSRNHKMVFISKNRWKEQQQKNNVYSNEARRNQNDGEWQHWCVFLVFYCDYGGMSSKM